MQATNDPTLQQLFELINNPITCGYLHAFCESEYSAENIKYIIEISTFRDLFRIDRVAWSKSYQTVDDEILGLEDYEIDTAWPSSYITEVSIRDKIDKIHELFISESGRLQICFPHRVLANTMKRIQFINLYGPEVFEESLIDPLKTMKRDILPRFLRSPLYQTMISRLEMLTTPPLATDLVLPIPPTNLNFELSELTPNRSFRLSEIVANRYLYLKFLSYLQECYCSENLICYRLICIFEEKIISKQSKQSIDAISWDIYRYFVADDSPYEISLEYLNKKLICLQLAAPTLSCYEDVKKSAFNMLKTFYSSYQNKPEYLKLSQYLHEKYSKNGHGGEGNNSTTAMLRNCLPIMNVGN